MLNIGSFKPLSELCSIISSGGTPSRKMPHYFDKNGHLWVKSKELLFKGIDDTEEKISDEGLKKSSAKYYPSGTILVAMYGANVGQLAWLKKPATVNQAICALVVDEQKADNMFVYYSLLHTREKLIVQAQGAAQQNLNAGQIKSFEIPYIDLENQQKVASILSAYDDLIENNNRRIAILEEMARSLYREWFVKFRFPGHEAVKMVDLELGQIPEGWEVSPLENLCSRITDGSHKSPKSVLEGFPMASVKDMHDFGLNVNSCRKISKEDFDDLVRNDCKVTANDVLIAKDGSYLKHTFVVEKDLDIALLSSIAILRPNNKIKSHFLSFCLKSPEIKERMKQCVSGVAIPRIILQDFRNFKIVVPAIDLQEQWNNLIKDNMQMCWNLIKKNDLLKTQRDMLLPKLISGKIHV